MVSPNMHRQVVISTCCEAAFVTVVVFYFIMYSFHVPCQLAARGESILTLLTFEILYPLVDSLNVQVEATLLRTREAAFVTVVVFYFIMNVFHVPCQLAPRGERLFTYGAFISVFEVIHVHMGQVFECNPRLHFFVNAIHEFNFDPACIRIPTDLGDDIFDACHFLAYDLFNITLIST